MIPLAAMSIAIVHRRYTNGVASPENGVENCGLKNVETAGPMMAADMITAPVRPTAFRRRPLPVSTSALTGAALCTASMDTPLDLSSGESDVRHLMFGWQPTGGRGPVSSPR